MNMRRRLALVVTAIAALVASLTAASCSTRQDAPGVRLYIFDNGAIKGLDPKLFNFAREEIKNPDFVDVSYLIVHPRGTLMFDSGAIADADFTGSEPAQEGILSASHPLKPQMAAAGFDPADVTYFALSHYHSDHTANANDFAGATWITQKAERDYMFQDNPQGIIRPAHYAALKSAKTKLLDNEDFDVFGDGMVVLKSAPGHTPGHQVLFVKLAKTGPVLLAGDLYHYPEERTTGKVPTFEFNAEQSRMTRQRIETFLKESGAALWIEHDEATHARLPKAPAFVD